MPQAPTGRPSPGPSRSGAALILDALLFPVVLAAVLLACVYLPLGLLAASVQDGLSEQMRAGLGVGSPLPLRLLRELQALLRLWPLGLGTAWFHVALRLSRRRSPFGESLVWDAVASPFLTVVALGALGFVWLLVWDRHAVDALLWPAAILGVSAFVALGLAGLLLALGRRHRGLRVAMAVVMVGAVGVRLGAEVWGRAALRSRAARRAPELAADEARRAARTRPVLRGEAIDEDAWPRYQRLIDGLGASLGTNPALRSLTSFGNAEPFAPIPPPAKAGLVARRADVLALREATRCRRCLPVVMADPVGPVPSLLGVRYLVILVTLEGNERAQAGNLAGAADHYLDLVRFGGDIGDGSVLHALLGTGVEQVGLHALGRLVRSGRLDASLLDRIEHERKILEGERVSLAQGLVGERRILDRLADSLDTWSSRLDEPLVLETVVPYRALAAHAVGVADPLFREFESALEKDDIEAWRRLVAKSDAIGASSGNPLLRLAMGYTGFGNGGTRSMRLFFTARDTLAWFRLVQAAVTLERAKRTGGHYPRDAEALDLPRDPFDPGHPLRYRPEGSSYRLWSVGRDGIDDGGKSEKRADVVLE